MSTDIEQLVNEAREWQTIEGVELRGDAALNVIHRLADALEREHQRVEILRLQVVGHELGWSDQLLITERDAAVKRAEEAEAEIARLYEEIQIARDGQDGALRAMATHSCGENVEAAYKRTVSAEAERDRYRAAIREAERNLHTSWCDLHSARIARERARGILSRALDTEKGDG